jgi:hypothetical protein
MKLKENNMFKKTLLALAVAGVTSTAYAGSITKSVTEETGAGTTTKGAAVAAIVAAADSCATAATAAGVTLDLDGNVHDDGAVNDTITIVDTATGVLSSTTSVVMTGTDTCDVTIADEQKTASAVKTSLEGATENGVNVTAALIAGVGGFQEESTITITVTGGQIDEAASVSATLASNANGGTGVYVIEGIANNSILFRTTTASAGQEIAELSGLVVTPDSGSTEVSISAVTQNTAAIVIDEAPETQVVQIAKQYTGTVTSKFDGIIDVQEERISLAVDADDNFNELVTDQTNVQAIDEDTLVVKTTLNTGDGNLDATVQEFTITGDFSWMVDLDADEDGDVESAEILTAISYASTSALDVDADDEALEDADGDDSITAAALSEDMKTLTLTGVVGGGVNDGTDVDTYHAITFTPPGVAGDGVTAFNTQDFTVDYVVKTAATDGVEMDTMETALDAGEWTLNGSVVTIPYMPYGDNTQVILRHLNTGVQTGGITVRYMLQADKKNPVASTDWVSVGEVATSSKGILDISSVVTAAIKDSVANTSGAAKVAIEITTNVPDEDVTVYASYKVISESDRGTIGTFGALASQDN